MLNNFLSTEIYIRARYNDGLVYYRSSATSVKSGRPWSWSFTTI
jgi:hypothetical protein